MLSLRSATFGMLAVVALGLISACGSADGVNTRTDPPQDAITAAAIASVGGEGGASGPLKPATASLASSSSTTTYTAKDVLAALKTAHGRFALAQTAAMDIDQDGAVTPKDAQKILQYALQRVARPNSAGTAWLLPTLFASSYENMKGQGLPQLPLKEFGFALTSAWAVGDFFGDGSVIVMLSRSNSLACYTPQGIDQKCLGPAPRYIKDEYRAEFEFYRLSASGLFEPTGNVLKGCLSPRKALVADFNRDGHPDIFVACHGWDSPNQWYEEPGRLLINDTQGKGAFTVTDLGATDRNADGSGYYHSASAADVDGDGYPDIVLADNMRRLPSDGSMGMQLTVLINQKTDPVTFVVDNSRIPGQTVGGPYMAVELIDMDGDGKVDVVAGGNEFYDEDGKVPASDTVILYNDGAGVFGARKSVIPPLAAYQNILDFTLIERATGEKKLLIQRVSGNYGIQAVQVYDPASHQSMIAWSATDSMTSWVEWWLPANRNGVRGIVPYAATSHASVFIAP